MDNNPAPKNTAIPRRHFLGGLATAGSAFAIPATMITEAAAQNAQPAAPLKGHFHPKGKAPSKFTVDLLKQAKATLPFADKRDFEEQKKGLIAPMKEMKIKADAGHVAWDMERFQFLERQEDFDSIHPSLLRQSVLNNNYGLYEVIPGIYQVRGFDLSDITFVRGKTGWIVIDPLVSAEPVRAAWALFQKHVGKGLPVSSVIYSHSHADHWGGVRGIVNEGDVRSGKIPVIAPRNFMEHTIAENVYAGNAMNRRLFYQYGLLLPASPHGYVGQGLGQGVSAGAVGLIAPNRLVEKEIEEIEVDGVKMIFQDTPNTEAPTEMNTYIPGMKALWMAENVIASLHNIYTLRGAPVRNPLNWSKHIAQALHRFGLEAEVMFASHHWPRWGNARIQEVLRGQRDLYAHMNNQVLHYANQGVTINEIHNVYELPKDLQDNFLGIRMDSRKAEGMRFTMNLITPDNGEKFLVELENATLTNIQGFQADKPDLTLTINRSDLEQTMMGAKTLEAQIKDGTARVKGDAGILAKLATTMVDFDPRFEIMPGTKARGPAVAHADPYEAVPGAAIAE